MTPKQKAIIAAVVACILAIGAGVVIYANGQHRKYLEAVGASAILTEQYNTFKAQADAAIVAKNAEIAEAVKAKDAAIEKANAAHAQQAVIQAKYNALKGETAALPATDLIIHINARIGSGNSWPTAGGLFSFTRVGAENTLNLFLDGESAIKQGAEYLLEISGLRSAVSIALTEIKIRDEKYALRDGEYVALWAAFDMQDKAMTHLRRSLFGRRLKSFAIGAGVGIVAGAIIYSQVSK